VVLLKIKSCCSFLMIDLMQEGDLSWNRSNITLREWAELGHKNFTVEPSAATHSFLDVLIPLLPWKESSLIPKNVSAVNKKRL